MLKISLTTDDIVEILDSIGSTQEISTVEDFIQYMYDGIQNKNLIGKDFKDISQAITDIAKKQNIDIPVKSLYNMKEKSKACTNCFERIKLLITTGIPTNQDDTPTTENSSSKEEPSPKNSTTTENTSAENSTTTEEPTIYENDTNSDFRLPTLEHMDYLYKKDIMKDYLFNDCNLDAYEMQYTPNQDISFEDNFIIDGVDLNKYTTKVVAIANSNNDIVAVGTLIQGNEGLHIVCDINHISNNWGNNIQYKVLIFPKSLEGYLNGKPIDINEKVAFLQCEIRMQEIQFFDNPLCIDFGTSNTTAGTFTINQDTIGMNPILVKFRDITQDTEVYSEIYPTIVYVEDCSDINNIKYLFGFDAKKKIKDYNYNTTATVFHEIKRWITSETKSENIVDENGNFAEVKRIDIIKAYLEHIVNIAERQFKCRFKQLHFTAPVKLKDKFNTIVKYCFENKQYEIIEAYQSLDEGIATIYESISNTLTTLNTQINPDGSKMYNHSKERSIMVLDCGGGTTDVASCKYSVVCDESQDYYHLNIKTQFESGDSNFGGNNITYRIMQLLKIKMAHTYKQRLNIHADNICTRISELIPLKTTDILSHIDNGQLDIYNKLEAEYEKAEKIIPTKFEDKNNPMTKYKNKKSFIKRNFYYLWQLAEKIKIEFYKKNDLLSIGFTNTDDEFRENILKKEDTNFYLHIYNDGQFIQSNDIPPIEINTKEIDTLIYADIYTLIHRIFTTNVDNQHYNYYKLSGQSCKIRLFNTLLTEFIPGQKLRNAQINYNQDSTSSKLKIGCINGAIKYIYDMKFGNIKPNIIFENPRLIYQISRNNGGNFEPIMYSKDGKYYIKVCLLPSNAEYTEILISEIYNSNSKDVNNIIKLNKIFQKSYSSNQLRDYLYKNTCLNHDVVDNVITHLESIETNENPNDNVKCYFVLPSNDCFSFNNYVIQKEINNQNEVYNIINFTTIPFENNLSVETFFDGKR